LFFFSIESRRLISFLSKSARIRCSAAVSSRAKEGSSHLKFKMRSGVQTLHRREVKKQDVYMSNDSFLGVEKTQQDYMEDTEPTI